MLCIVNSKNIQPLGSATHNVEIHGVSMLMDKDHLQRPRLEVLGQGQSFRWVSWRRASISSSVNKRDCISFTGVLLLCPLRSCRCDKNSASTSNWAHCRRGLFVLTAPEGRAHHGKIGRTQPEQEAERSCFHPQADNRKNKQEVGRGYELLKPAPSAIFPLASLYLPITSPNIAANWGPNVQIYKPMGDSSQTTVTVERNIVCFGWN